jgi:hypothetical protein
MSDKPFTPYIAVHHTSRLPQPILPLNYGFFLFIPLPEEIASLSLLEQLLAAKVATARRLAYPFPGPFGAITGFEFRLSLRRSIYLNADGDLPPNMSRP